MAAPDSSIQGQRATTFGLFPKHLNTVFQNHPLSLENVSSGTATSLAAVSDWRFLNALGGNFKLRGLAGLPIYEDLNSQKARNARGRFKQVQAGEGALAICRSFGPFWLRRVIISLAPVFNL